MSDAGVPVEHIALLVGHSRTMTTETVYRKQIRPVLLNGETIKGHLPRLQVACELVGVAGFEPAASSSRTKRAAKLRHTPPTAREV